MTDAVRHPGRRLGGENASEPEEHVATQVHEELAKAAASDEDLGPEPHFEEGIVDEVSHVVDDGIAYAQAEIAFQKTRASLAGKSAGFAAVYLIVALVVFHIALLALAVGLVMALAPLVTIWGAIAIVVGTLLLLTAWLGLKAKGQADRISALFASEDDGDGS